MIKFLSTAFLTVLLVSFTGSGRLSAQFSGNATLVDTYHLTLLEVDSLAEVVDEVSQLGGDITFDGAGNYAFSGERASLVLGTSNLEVAGRYSVDPAGNVTLSHPTREGMSLMLTLSGDLNVLLGATSGSADGVRGFFVAVLEGVEVTNASLAGAFTGGVLEFPSASPSMFSSSLVSLIASGAGAFSPTTLIGNRTGATTTREEITGATYSLSPDGSGTAAFGGSSSFLFGTYKVFVSANGNYLIGYSTGLQRSILVASKDHVGPGIDLFGRFWTAELLFDGTQFTSGAGALQPDGDELILISQEVRYDDGEVDFSGLNFFATDETGTGWFANRPLEDVINMHLAVTENDGEAGAMIGAQVGSPGSVFPEVGLFFAVRVPSFDSSDFYADPSGVVNGASFALLPNPVAPGSIVSMFGLGFVPRLGPPSASAMDLPLPLELLELSVTANNQPAGLFFASNGQVNLQIPFGLTGDRATIRVTTSAGNREVIVPLAPTSPGVFSFIQPQSFYAAIVTHVDGVLVTLERPAAPGETVVIYLTGLGELRPAVASGAGNPGLDSDPLAVAADPNVFVLFNQELGEVLYAGGAPGFAGLNQINVTIPLNVLVGENVALAIATTNAFHDQTDIPIGGVALLTEEGVANRAASVSVAVPPRARGAR